MASELQRARALPVDCLPLEIWVKRKAQPSCHLTPKFEFDFQWSRAFSLDYLSSSASKTRPNHHHVSWLVPKFEFELRWARVLSVDCLASYALKARHNHHHISWYPYSNLNFGEPAHNKWVASLAVSWQYKPLHSRLLVTKLLIRFSTLVSPCTMDYLSDCASNISC